MFGTTVLGINGSSTVMGYVQHPSAAGRSLKKPDGYVLEDFADSARKIVEGAWEALERHTTEHGC